MFDSGAVAFVQHLALYFLVRGRIPEALGSYTGGTRCWASSGKELGMGMRHGADGLGRVCLNGGVASGQHLALHFLVQERIPEALGAYNRRDTVLGKLRYRAREEYAAWCGWVGHCQ